MQKVGGPRPPAPSMQRIDVVREEPEIEGDHPFQLQLRKKKRGHGRPCKTSKLYDISFSQVESLFGSVKEKWTAILTDHMAEALTPIRALVKDQIKTMKDRLTEMNDRFIAQLYQVSSDLKSIRDQQHQQAATTMETVADKPSGKPNYARSVLNLDMSREINSSQPTLSQPSDSSCVPSAKSD